MEFLRFVVNDLYKKFEGQLENVTVVLPTRRAALFIRKYLAELAGDKPVCAPQCTTITDMFDSLCALRSVDEIKAVCLLYEIYKQKTEHICTANPTLTLDCFYSWGRQLIADFDNVDKNYIDSTGEEIFRSSAEAHEFDKDNLDNEVKVRIMNLVRGQTSDAVDRSPADRNAEDGESFRKTFELVWQQLPAIYKEFSQRLLRENCALEGARNKWVVRNFETLWQDISDTTFAFVGFNILSATERTLMRLIDNKQKALFYWDYDAAFDEAEPFIPAYRNVRDNIRELHGLYDASPSRTETINVVSAASDNAQARYVHDWLLANHKDGQMSAVVLCNEAMLHPVVFSIPNQFSGNVNITKGFPMKHTRVYARICSWLRNPANTIGCGGVMDMLVQLRGFIDDEWSAASPEQPPVPPEQGGPSGPMWHEMLDRESIYQARCVVVRFISLAQDGVLNHVEELHTVRNLLTAHLGTINIPFHGEPVTDLQIMGVLETRGLDFDNILMLNVEEGVVPQSGHDNSFIPYYLRKYYKLTTLDDQAQVYSYNFFRILRRARNVTLLFSEALTSEGQKSMSRFVMQILASRAMRPLVSRHKLVCTPVEAGEAGAKQADQWAEAKHTTTFTTYMEKLLAGQRNHPGNELRLSPSAINTYLQCKRRFFMKYMLDLTEPAQNDNLMQMNELGTLIHESVRAAYSLMTNGKGEGSIAPQTIEAFLRNPDNIDKAVRMAYRAMNLDHHNRNSEPDDRGLPSAAKAEPAPEVYAIDTHPIETTVAKKHLQNVLRNDSKLRELQILGSEIKKYARIDICGMGSILVGGSIDRLDIVSEGQERVLRVVDYKTGHYDKKKMTAGSMAAIFQPGTQQGYVLQTMIYSLACLEDPQLLCKHGGKRVKPQLLFTQKKLTDFNPNLIVDGEPITDFRPCRENFKESLTQLVGQILRETEFEPPSAQSEANSPCRYCSFAVLCGK